MNEMNDLPVLEPDLDYPHVQPGVLTELLADVSRRFGAGVVGRLERLQLLGRDGRPWPLGRIVTFCSERIFMKLIQ